MNINETLAYPGLPVLDIFKLDFQNFYQAALLLSHSFHQHKDRSHILKP